MKDLHIGDFIITKDGEVGKVIHFNKSEVITDNGVFSPSEIDGHKPTLTELAREGDFINGAKISRRSSSGLLSVNGHSVEEDKILQFMTKKKFYRECYSPVIREDNEWKKIKQVPMYEISRNGIIRNSITGKYVTNRENVSKTTVRLEIGGGKNRLTFNVAELVLEAFIGSKEDCIVKYKDGNPNNVNLDNLEWIEKPIEVKNEKVKKEKKVLVNDRTTDVKKTENKETKTTKKQYIQKPMTIKPKKNNLDEIDDNDFYKEMERKEKLKKEKFKQELLKRLHNE